MNKKISIVFVVMCLILVNISIAGAVEEKNTYIKEDLVQSESYDFSDEYYVQWVMNFDSDFC